MRNILACECKLKALNSQNIGQGSLLQINNEWELVYFMIMKHRMKLMAINSLLLKVVLIGRGK